MNSIIYCRVSSREQIEGTSLETQELACREYARSKHLGILRVFVEQGESAKFADRTELLKLIEFCRENKGKVQHLLVWKIDRFARNVADHFSVKAALSKYGVRIVSVTEPIDANPEGRLLETILAGFAQFDNDIRALRTVQGMRRKLQEGIYPFPPPLGYKASSGNGEKKTEPDQPDQPVFSLLSKIWAEFATGAFTKAEIRRLMHSRGIVGRKGQPLPPQSIDNLFRNPYYAGILVDPWSGDEYKAGHSPMVSREDFARVQKVVARRNRSRPHLKHRPEFPLRGLVRCRNCKHPLTGSFSTGRSRRYPYYRCGNQACRERIRSLPVDQIHAEFESTLSLLTPGKEALERMGLIILRTADRRAASEKARETRKRNVLERLRLETQQLIQMRARGLISDREFVSQKRSLDDRQIAAEASRARTEIKPAEIKRRLAEISLPLTRLAETCEKLPPKVRHRFQQLIFPVGFVAGQSGTAETGLLFSVFRHFREGNATLVPREGIEPPTVSLRGSCSTN